MLACGVSSFAPNLRIVGGIPAGNNWEDSLNLNSILLKKILVPNSWPSQVLIIMRYIGTYRVGNQTLTIQGSEKCAGTLITPSVVLTAAHCVSSSFQYSNGEISTTLPIQTSWYYPT